MVREVARCRGGVPEKSLDSTTSKQNDNISCMKEELLIRVARRARFWYLTSGTISGKHAHFEAGQLKCFRC